MSNEDRQYDREQAAAWPLFGGLEDLTSNLSMAEAKGLGHRLRNALSFDLNNVALVEHAFEFKSGCWVCLRLVKLIGNHCAITAIEIDVLAAKSAFANLSRTFGTALKTTCSVCAFRHNRD